MSAEAILTGLLQVAVPLRIIELQQHGGITDDDLVRIASYQQDLGEHGEDLLFQSKKKGQSAARFNQVVDCIAVMSFVPGGITLFGAHWESTVVRE